MQVEVVRPGELGPAELAAWRGMQRDTPALQSPFLAPEFTLAVGRARSDARVAVLIEDGRIAGFFAFHRRPLGRGVPIGVGLADVQGVVHAPGATWDAQALLAGCGLAVWEFEHLIADQAAFRPHHVAAAPSPVIDLGGGFAAYAEQRARASERVRVARRKARKLARELGELRFDADLRDPRALGLVLRWKSAQYRRTGRADRFARPWIHGLVEALFAQRAPGCTPALSVLWAGDRPVAGHFGLRSERVLASWFPAYDVAAARYSPGWLLFLGLAEAAAAWELQALDLGAGDEPYKQSLKTGDRALAAGWVQRPSMRARAAAVRREPARRATGFVLARPALRRAARGALRGVGRLRTGAQRQTTNGSRRTGLRSR